MKIVFLDIDGVLATYAGYSKGWHYFDDGHYAGDKWARGGFPNLQPECIAVLNKITDETDAKIVVSSTWRNGSVGDFMDLQRFLQESGVKADVIDRTPLQVQGARRPSRGQDYQRGDQIKAWLNLHLEVTAFVVLDDDSDMDAVRDNFVQTTNGLNEGGLTEEYGNRAIEILKK